MRDDYVNNQDLQIEKLEIIGAEIRALAEDAGKFRTKFREEVLGRVGAVEGELHEHRRTLERRFESANERVDAVNKRIDDFVAIANTLVNDAKGHLNQKVESIERDLAALNERVNRLAPEPGSPPDAVRALAVSVPQGVKNIELLLKSFRVVNSAEDLVLDDSFDARKNSSLLANRLDPKLDGTTAEVLELFKDDPLQDKFKSIFNSIDGKARDELLRQRMERVAAIQRLRHDLAAFFSR